MMKFGLMKYSYTTNLGNEIQSIAARRFLPKVDYYIEHEKLNLFQSPKKVKLIMNGWYFDCLKSWPPSDSIDPLLISMHFNASDDVKKVLSSKESEDFFSSYGPVGCRDYSTLNFLNELGIDAYYSGCLTLTLEKTSPKTHRKYIVVNCYDDEIIDFLKTKTNLPIYDIHQESFFSFDKRFLKREARSYYLTSFFDYNEKFFLAENILKLYENAHCVITDRVHCAFPCLAFKTPVLFFNSAKFEPNRFKGIDELVSVSNFQEYKTNYDMFDVENPPKNSDKYLRIKKDLIKKTKKFTGHLSDSYELYFDDDEIRNFQTNLLTAASRESRKYMIDARNLSNNYETKISDKDKSIEYFRNSVFEKDRIIGDYEDLINQKNKTIENQNKTIEKQKMLINEMQKSISWKLTKPIRKWEEYSEKNFK